MFSNIRWRIAIPYVILILAAMGGLTLYLSRLARDTQLADLEANLLIGARAVAESAVPLLANPEGDALDALAREWSALLEARVTIIAPDGTVLGESHEDRSQMDNHLTRPEVQQALAGGQGSSIRYSETVNYDMMYVAVPVTTAGGERLGVVRVALPLDQIEENVSRLRQTIFTATLLTAMLAAMIAIAIAERTARPVRRLTELARRMAAGDLDARLYRAGRDEVGELARAFNHMADQLRDQVQDLVTERGRLAAVLENMADGVIITDDVGRVRLINPAAARLLSVGPADSAGRSFAEVARHHHLIELWQQGCSQGQERVATVELDRQGTFIQMIVTPLTSAGVQTCLVILQDLTRIRRLETVRRDFISNISHELRTPLASLKAVVETLRDSALDDPPAARRFLDRADQEVDALTQMVQELLELSRIESGKVPLRLSPTAVASVVAPPVERLQTQAERNSLRLVAELPAGLPLVLVDADRVQQVVANLVHNAIKFTPDGGEIRVTAEWQPGQPEVVVQVRDTGVGIPAGELERIFERFYKSDRARSGGGTGLGLAIARHLVQAHGGRIWAKSREGKGSTFYFSLPVADGTGQGDS
ncbi:MAG: cell wall metabolism sensor histidine kinase WalK [Chloroflexi bacterium]|nr:cell wall metabolism sensor histidine kinase WalK [Chloroflexota bacterium]MCI0575490.1 cell wall metabolism sensor histidine kinase WalK [Chloroflexota bacterium]MCI0646672.1 cell wall metabolism sensor histidine kinase WalK [Chloroflexota bacterium]MCI0726401.1 cell wall metabolism sensor histidine kinase WalK [Chloroflexota bacterium]